MVNLKMQQTLILQRLKESEDSSPDDTDLNSDLDLVNWTNNWIDLPHFIA